MTFKLFDKWETAGVIVSDPGLQRYITLKPLIVPKSNGRLEHKKFWKSRAHIVERLMNKIAVSGHRGKKQWRTSGRNAGKFVKQFNILSEVFDTIEKKLKENPIQVLVRAVENSAPCAEVIPIEYGGIKHPRSVDVAPQRRVDLALRWFVQGAYQEAVSKKISFAQALASNIIGASQNDAKSFSVSKKSENERQAVASR